MITQDYADEIGADGYSKDAADAVKLTKADFADCGLKEADIVGGFMITWILERTYFGKMRRNL